MAFNFLLPVRIAQALFAVITLGLAAYVASWWNATVPTPSPSQLNFLLFASVWTFAVAVPYLALSPRFFPTAAHKYGILAVEALTMIFWFAGFLAVAAFLGGLAFCHGTVCGAAKGAVVFGAFEWYYTPMMIFPDSPPVKHGEVLGPLLSNDDNGHHPRPPHPYLVLRQEQGNALSGENMRKRKRGGKKRDGVERHRPFLATTMPMHMLTLDDDDDDDGGAI